MGPEAQIQIIEETEYEYKKLVIYNRAGCPEFIIPTIYSAFKYPNKAESDFHKTYWNASKTNIEVVANLLIGADPVKFNTTGSGVYSSDPYYIYRLYPGYSRFQKLFWDVEIYTVNLSNSYDENWDPIVRNAILFQTIDELPRGLMLDNFKLYEKRTPIEDLVTKYDFFKSAISL